MKKVRKVYDNVYEPKPQGSSKNIGIQINK